MEITLFELSFSDNKDKEQLYIRGNRSVCCGENLTTDTYFNSFSCSKYSKYTICRNLTLQIAVSGNGTAKLCHIDESSNISEICSLYFDTDKEQTIELSVDDLSAFSSGYIYLKLSANNKSCTLHRGRYITKTEDKINPISLGIVFCTFRREEFVKHNISVISEYLNNNKFDNASIDIFCIDNGGTLIREDVCVADNIHFSQNKNYGGSGGFTRGMIEMLQFNKPFTHAWVMDDDIEFETSSITRVLSFLQLLKPEYSDYHIAAGMMTFEGPTMQYEATAKYNGFSFKSNNSNIDLSCIDNLFYNEKEVAADYAGWWSLVIPFSNIRDDSLPLPLFIKLDDAEFGLRTTRKFTTLNGFGVWHQAFTNKVSAHLEYYTTRNALILSALYYSGKKRVLILFSRLIKAISFNQPIFMEAAAKGAADYIKGPEFLMNSDAAELNAEIMQGFKFSVSVPSTRKKMLVCMLKNLFKPNTLKSTSIFLKAIGNNKKYKIANKDYNDNFKTLTSLEFWKRFML